MTLQTDFFKQPQNGSEICQYETRSQGAEANAKGRELEHQVRSLFTGRGALLTPYQKYVQGSKDFFNRRLLVPQFPYSAVMGQRARADLVYFHDSTLPGVGIECKVQDDSGSADEKLFVMFHNSRRWQFADHSWFVLSGTGFRKHFVEWLQTKASTEFPGGPKVRVFVSLDVLRVAVKALVMSGDAGEGR